MTWFGTRGVVRAIAVSLPGLVLSAGAAAQTNATWLEPVTDLWSVPTRWSTLDRFPNNNGEDFNAIIAVTGGAYTVTLDRPITVTGFDLTSPDASLDLAGFTLTLEGAYTFEASRVTSSVAGGTITAQGTTTLSGGALEGIALQTQGSLTFAAGPVGLDICDTDIDHSGSAASWSGGDIVLDSAATFTLRAPSTFTITTDADMTGLAGSLFRNEGAIIRSTDPGQTFLNGVIFDNAGSLDVGAGTLSANVVQNVVGTSLNGGSWTVRTGGTIDLIGASIVTNNASITLAGSGAFPAVTNNIAITTSDGVLEVTDGANVTTPGDYTNNGVLKVSDATFTVNSGSMLTNYDAGTDTLGGGTFEIEAAARGTTGRLRFDGADIAVIDDASVTLRGASAGIFDPTMNEADGVRNLRSLAGLGAFMIDAGRNFMTMGDFELSPAATLGVGAGSTFDVSTEGQLLNLVEGQLMGGNYMVKGMLAANELRIVNLGASVVLDGPQAVMFSRLQQTNGMRFLSFMQTGSSLEIRGGQNLSLNAGTFQMAMDSSLMVASDNPNMPSRLGINGIFQQAGNVTLDDGRIDALGLHLITGAVRGNGIIRNLEGFAFNNGLLDPGLDGAGRLIMDSDVEHSIQGILEIELGGTTPGIGGFDQLIVGGELRFTNQRAGILRIALINDFVPAPGDMFDIILFQNMIGTFEEIQGLQTPGGMLEVVIENDRFQLVLVPAPGAIAVVGGIGLLALRRRREG
jgi:hypothetical protein